MNTFYKEYSSLTYPQVPLFVKDALWARDKRDLQIKDRRRRLLRKRLNVPLRYRCAAFGCGIEADTEKMLQQCTP